MNRQGNFEIFKKIIVCALLLLPRYASSMDWLGIMSKVFGSGAIAVAPKEPSARTHVFRTEQIYRSTEPFDIREEIKKHGDIRAAYVVLAAFAAGVYAQYYKSFNAVIGAILGGAFAVGRGAGTAAVSGVSAVVGGVGAAAGKLSDVVSAPPSKSLVDEEEAVEAQEDESVDEAQEEDSGEEE